MVMWLFHRLELLRGTRSMTGAACVLTWGSLVGDAALAVHVLSTGAASALFVVHGGEEFEGEHFESNYLMKPSFKDNKNFVAARICTAQLASGLLLDE